MFKRCSLLAIVTSILLACGDSSSGPVNEEQPASSAKASSSSEATANSSSSIGDVSSSSATAESKDWREECLDIINQYRATEGTKPLTLAPETKQTCTDKQAAADLKSNKAHGHFGDCGEFAQNSGPNINLSWKGTESDIVNYYLKMMWDEKDLITSGKRDPEKKEDYSYIGHYLNMSNTKYSSVACGIAKSSDGKTGWLNINFY